MYSVKALLLLDSEGFTVFAKYYPRCDLDTTLKQKCFEKTLFEKTEKQNTDVALLDQHIVIYRSIADMVYYIVCGTDENELIIASVLDCFLEVFNEISKGAMDKKSVLENYDIVCLLVDELVDNGIIMEIDPRELLQRIPRRSTETQDTPLSEQTLSQAIQTAKYWKDQIFVKN